MKGLTALFVIFSFLSAKAQEHPAILSFKYFGGDGSEGVSNRVTNTPDGGFIVAIGSNSFNATGSMAGLCVSVGSRSIFQKYKSDASSVEWTKCFGSLGDSSLAYMYPQSDGSTVFGGVFNSTVGWGAQIAKHDNSDNIIWQKNYSKGNGSLLRDMIKVDDGGYIMASECFYQDTNAIIHYGNTMVADIWVIKLDSEGNKIWSRVFGGSDEDYVRQIVTAPDGGCYVVGGSRSTDFDCTDNHGGSDAFIIRLDSNGNIVWKRMYGGSDDDGAAYACSNGKGGIIVSAGANSTDGDVHGHIKGQNIWILEIDSVGNIIWDNCYGGGGYENPSSICKSVDGTIWFGSRTKYAGGQIDVNYSREDGWLAHIGDNGQYLSGQVMGSTAYDDVTMLQPLPGGLVLAGGVMGKPDGFFATGGEADAYLTILAPWTTTVNQALSINKSFNLLPNPANQSLTIETEISKAKLLIIDATGKKIYNQVINGNHNIDVSHWSSGVYEVNLSAKDILMTKKLIIQ